MSEQYEQVPLPQGDDDAILNKESPLSTAIPFYVEHMRYEGFAENTIKAFVSDLNLVGQYAGLDMPVGKFATKNLQEFLRWLLHERGVPCSPKSYARRVTTVKVFFRWLYQSDVIARDPADIIIHEPASSPLPIILHDNEVERLLAATEVMRYADKPDARPHLLVSLLLQTGLKKGETVALRPDSIDTSKQDEPTLWVRYDNPRMRYKERRLQLEASVIDVLDEYLAQYEPPEGLFNCTARNLEYILRDAANSAGIDKKVSFEALRWTSAVRDYRSGMDLERLRQKMGLSRVTWRETGAKIGRLAEKAL